MLNKFFKFLKGYVIIEISGSCTERFLNICTRRNIDVRQVTHVSDKTFTAQILKRDFKRLSPVAFKTKTRVKIIKKRGLYNLIRRYGTRYFFMGGALGFLAFIFIMSQFIWLVEINGVYSSDREEIIQILEDNGIYSGALKCRIPSIRSVKNDIITNTEGIAWAWVYIEGAKARVEIYERALPPAVTDKRKPCDIVAACDGFIESIDAQRGEQTVPNGNAVSAGDVLISGTVPVYREGYEEKYIQVHAKGSVRAITYHEETGDYKEYRELRIPTGREKNRYSIEVFGKVFGKCEFDGYENYDVKNSRRELVIPYVGYSGIAVNKSVFSEVEPVREELSEDTALEIAKNDLEEKISSRLFKNTDKQEETVECERVDSETIRVTVKMTCIEDIGIEQEITEGVNMLDKQTD
ncbi:MAG: sporulation protein YqfD [Clostridiales bacterium]|nr:sporulation protein YqfD [Clostridiales bacterium]